MKIRLITVGKTDVNWVKEGLELYISRLKHYIPFELCEIAELKNVSSLSKNQIKDKEAQLIIKQLKPQDYVILLDERGKQYRSVDFAEFIENHSIRSNMDLVFVVGGAYGFSDEIYNLSKSLISLSKMTFSHQMIRTIFVEQLYRAFTIIKGEPYHHE